MSRKNYYTIFRAALGGLSSGISLCSPPAGKSRAVAAATIYKRLWARALGDTLLLSVKSEMAWNMKGVWAGENCTARVREKDPSVFYINSLGWLQSVLRGSISSVLAHNTTHIAAGDKTRWEISPKTVYDEFYYARRDFSLFICSTTYSSHKYYIVSIKVKSIRFNFFSLSCERNERRNGSGKLDSLRWEVSILDMNWVHLFEHSADCGYGFWFNHPLWLSKKPFTNINVSKKASNLKASIKITREESLKIFPWPFKNYYQEDQYFSACIFNCKTVGSTVILKNVVCQYFNHLLFPECFFFLEFRSPEVRSKRSIVHGRNRLCMEAAARVRAKEMIERAWRTEISLQ